MTDAQIASAVLCRFNERGFTLEQCAEPARVIASAVKEVGGDQMRLIDLSVNLFAGKMRA